MPTLLAAEIVVAENERARRGIFPPLRFVKALLPSLSRFCLLRPLVSRLISSLFPSLLSFHGRK